MIKLIGTYIEKYKHTCFPIFQNYLIRYVFINFKHCSIRPEKQYVQRVKRDILPYV